MMTPKELFEELMELVNEEGYEPVKDTVDSMWELIRHLNGENRYVERWTK